MTNESEFYKHLTNIDSMEQIVGSGLSPEVLPTEAIRPVYEYALDYYFASGKTRVISATSLLSYEVSAGRTMLDLLADADIALEEPEESIADILMKLQGQYILTQTHLINRSLVTNMAAAPIDKRSEVLQEGSTAIIRLLTRLAPPRAHVDAREGIADRLRAYEARTLGHSEGMLFGVPQIDEHMGGTHPGELTVLGAFTGLGKSFLVDRVALREHERGKTVALFTLENSIDMTQDRIACVACSVDAAKWDRGQCDPTEVDMVRTWADKMKDSPTPLHILQPPKEGRTVEAMMRQAQVVDADAVIIDQLSHIYYGKSGRNQPRNEVVRDIVQELKVQASTGLVAMPVLLVVQINRTGKTTADKRGWYELPDLAESSEVEKSADAVFTMYQSNDMRKTHRALIQVLKGRRFDIKWWDVEWRPGFGHLKVRSERVPYQV